MNAKREKNNENIQKSKQIKLLRIISIVLLAVVVLVFSYGRFLPTFSEIGYRLFGIEPNDFNSDYVRFIDVGQGDAILINSSGATALIDLGGEKDDGEELVKDLNKYGVYKLDCVIVSHFDSDHIGGDEVLNRIEIRNIIMPETNTEGSTKTTKSFDEFDLAARKSGANIYVAQVGTKVTIGNFDLTIIAYYPDSDDSNDSSVMVMAEIDSKKFLLTGDASKDIEERMLQEGYLLDCDVFKAAHHGSRYSNSKEFLEATTPTYTVISCSADNTYGHPHAEVLSNLKSVNSLIYRTDIKGDITFYVNFGNITVKTEK